MYARLAVVPLVFVFTATAATAGPTSTVRRGPEGGLVLVDPGIVGMDAARLRAVDALIERAIADGVTPGAAIAIGRHGRLVRLRGYGATDWATGAPAVDENTLFDLASLTKPIATTTAAMLLVQHGLLDLDAPLSKYLPEFRGRRDRRNITARLLLEHRSGLPAGGWMPPLADRDAVVGFLAHVKLRARAGRRTLYSDYGMILLGALIERISGQRLDTFVQRGLTDPLGLSDTGFNPLTWLKPGSSSGDAAVAGAGLSSAFDLTCTLADSWSRIAPTERNRYGQLQGSVHDPLAAALGGVAGNAGLFSSASDLAVFAQMILDHGTFGGVRVLDSAVVARFTRRRDPDAHYALGWELQHEDCSCGDLFSRDSFGHTGYTGTSIWIDPDQDLFVVLLTNRVNPSASEHRHIELRREVHDAVQRAIIDGPEMVSQGK